MNNSTSIIAIGAATQDVFVTGKALTAKRDVRTKSYVEQFPLGAKIELDNVFYDTGGGATNAAVTFARQGLNSSFLGKIGHDPAGTEILRVLQREGIATDHVNTDTKLGTGYSVLLLAPNGERTILVYRGASHSLSAKEFNIKNLRADWFYISALAGNLDLLKKLVSHAKKHGIRVAYNPGSAELKQAKKLKGIINGIEVLLANKEEMKLLFGGEMPPAILTEASRHAQFVVMTDGPGGTHATDGFQYYQAGIYQKVKVVDRTGAGDAFGSGFVAALARGMDMVAAISLASANSTAVVQKIGAKPGILRTDRIKKMKVSIKPL